ncbi:MAG: hypothetical protein ACREPV_01270 [Lysobacter sp.]
MNAFDFLPPTPLRPIDPTLLATIPTLDGERTDGFVGLTDDERKNARKGIRNHQLAVGRGDVAIEVEP